MAAHPARSGEVQDGEAGMTGEDRRLPVRSMAVATGVAVASIYYAQPMLALLAQDFPGNPLVPMIPTATQAGYALGLLFLVPLGDLMERRRLIVVQFLILALVLALTAAAPGVGVLLAASVLLGAASTVAQQVVPFAAHLAAPERRGAVVGSVMAGLLGGILLSRTVAGFTAEAFGWPAIFAISAPVAALTGLWLGRVLPEGPAESRQSYGRLMVTLIHLWREFPTLRRAAYTQGLVFGAFSVFWTILALQLASPQYGLGAATAGSFGLLGMTGVLIAPVAGRVGDRIGPERVAALGAGVAFLAWLVFGFWGSLIGLGIGVVVLDFGAQVSMVSNQSIIYALRPEARSRINTLYMSVMFVGGAAASAAAALAWRQSGWPGVCMLGAGLTLAAVALQAHGLTRTRGARGVAG